MNKPKERLLSAVGSDAIKDADRILRLWNDEEKVLRPDPNNKSQVRLATKFSEVINQYESCQGFLRYKKRERTIESKGQLEKVTRLLANAGEPDPKRLAKALTTALPLILENQALGFVEKTFDAAINLREVYNEAKAQRVLIDGEALAKKLKQCQEDNEKLSRQILEYKAEYSLRN